MSEIRSISTGTYTIGQTSNLNFEAGTGINITEPSEGTVRIANDETVLFENSADESTTSFTLSEKLTNFEKIRIFANVGPSSFVSEVFSTSLNANDSTFRYGSTIYMADNDGSPLQIYGISYSSNDGLTYTSNRSSVRWFAQGSTTSFGGGNSVINTIYKIVGVNRIAGGNP